MSLKNPYMTEDHAEPRLEVNLRRTWPSGVELLSPIKAGLVLVTAFGNGGNEWLYIKCRMEDGSLWNLRRSYQDLCNLQNQLITAYPVEAVANLGGLPSISEPTEHISNIIRKSFHESLDGYFEKLFQQKLYLERVKGFFAPRYGDDEIEPRRAESHGTMSDQSGHSSNSQGGLTSRHSSVDHLRRLKTPNATFSDGKTQTIEGSRDHPERGTSVERCEGCNEAWKRPALDMDQELGLVETNADYMGLASNMINRLRDRTRAADKAYEEWKSCHSDCRRPTILHSTSNLPQSHASPAASLDTRKIPAYVIPTQESHPIRINDGQPFEGSARDDSRLEASIDARLSNSYIYFPHESSKDGQHHQSACRGLYGLSSCAPTNPAVAASTSSESAPTTQTGSHIPARQHFKSLSSGSSYLAASRKRYRSNAANVPRLPEQFFTQQYHLGARKRRHNVRFADNYMPSSQGSNTESTTDPAPLPVAAPEGPIAGRANKRQYFDRNDQDSGISTASETDDDMTATKAIKRQRKASPQKPQERETLQYRGLAVPRLLGQDLLTHGDDFATENLASDTGRQASQQDLQNHAERPECSCKSLHLKHILGAHRQTLIKDPQSVQSLLPEDWKWDLQYQPGPVDSEQFGVWTCTPFEIKETLSYPLTISGAPVVLPVESRWPPTGGVNPPPDPRPLSLIDCRTTPSVDIVKDIFVTFEGCIGFYLLINGTLQLIVSENFDTTMASSHLPHKYGGLNISYIKYDMKPTMLPSNRLPADTTATDARTNSSLSKSAFQDFFRPFRPTSAVTTGNTMTLEINDFIEARGKSSNKQKYSGRIGLQVIKEGCPFLIMSSHVITEAMLSRSFLGVGRVHTERLKQDWNDHVEIWAANERIGHVEKSYDVEVGLYPDGFKYDCTLIKPQNASFIQDVKSPIADMGWLSRDSWSSLRQQTSNVKILGRTESHRNAKSVKCHLCSDVLIVGEGIFLNQAMAAGKPLKDRSQSTWENLVSRAVLYRVSPDFDPPTGYSGIALYAEGTREDGTQGPGIVGFQSFVQTSESVQSYEMEGRPLEQRLQKGRVAFYGAFQVPDELRQHYSIV